MYFFTYINEDRKTSLPGSPETPSATPTPAIPSASMSTQSTTSSDAFVYIGSGAALFIVVVVLTATVLCIAVMLFKKKGIMCLSKVYYYSGIASTIYRKSKEVSCC